MVELDWVYTWSACSTIGVPPRARTASATRDPLPMPRNLPPTTSSRSSATGVVVEAIFPLVAEDDGAEGGGWAIVDTAIDGVLGNEGGDSLVDGVLAADVFPAGASACSEVPHPPTTASANSSATPALATVSAHSDAARRDPRPNVNASATRRTARRCRLTSQIVT